MASITVESPAITFRKTSKLLLAGVFSRLGDLLANVFAVAGSLIALVFPFFAKARFVANFLANPFAARATRKD